MMNSQTRSTTFLNVTQPYAESENEADIMSDFYFNY